MKNGQKTLFFTHKNPQGQNVSEVQVGYQSEVSRDHLAKIAGIYDAPSARLAP